MAVQTGKSKRSRGSVQAVHKKQGRCMHKVQKRERAFLPSPPSPDPPLSTAWATSLKGNDICNVFEGRRGSEDGASVGKGKGSAYEKKVSH